jgi:sugar/nucleoside kinase (ribokinase family)
MGTGLLCIGLTTVDIVARAIETLPADEVTAMIEGIEIVPAGTAAGTAMIAAKLGVKTALVGSVGDDRAGRFVRMALDEQGVDTTLLATKLDARTSATLLAVSETGKRPNFHAWGAGVSMEVGDAATSAAKAAKFVHWAGVGGEHLDGGPGAAFLAAARANGAVITCDMVAPQPGALDELKRVLPHVDYFMPSVVEAFALAGTDDLAAAADFYLGLGARACIFKNGAAGSYLALGAERISLPAHAISPIDTTSCGDSYCAGFIAALDRGWSVVEACRFGTATGALVAQGLGTLGRIETFAKTAQIMNDVPLLGVN